MRLCEDLSGTEVSKRTVCELATIIIIVFNASRTSRLPVAQYISHFGYIFHVPL